MKRVINPVFLYVVLVFLSGVVVGVFGFELYHAHHIATITLAASPNELLQRWQAELVSRLQLTPEQARKLDAILAASHVRYHALRVKYWPEVKAAQDWQAEQIRNILDPVQRAEYEKMRAERDRDLEQRQHE
jgi:hypothetical protein